MDHTISRGVGGIINTAKAYPRSFLHETQVVIRPPTDVEIAPVIDMVAAERIKQWPALASWLRAAGIRHNGIPKFNLHALQYACAVTNLWADPTALWRISQHLGHTTTAVTIKYYLALLSEDHHDLAMAGLDKAVMN